MDKKKTMMDYILETPQTVTANIDRSVELTKKMVDLYLAQDYDSICIVACGSSYNGSLCARYFLRSILKTEVKLVTPFTFVNYEHDLREKAFTVNVSQSGCSTNSIECLKLLRANGETTIGLTGRDDCDFVNYCDHLINWGVGTETVGFVTKGVVTLAAFWMLFALEAAKRKGSLSVSAYNDYKNQMKKAMVIQKALVQETLTKYAANYKTFTSMDKMHILGSGDNYGTAVEGCLKISETACIPGLAYENEEFLHGPIIQFDPTYTVVLIDNGSHDPSSERIIDTYRGLRIITDRAFIISNDPQIEEDHAFRTIDETDPLISPLYNLCVFETLAYKVTEDTVHWYEHPLYKKFKDSKIVESKSRDNLYSL